jgi:GNAT superfamily N-acetyltransferase
LFWRAPESRRSRRLIGRADGGRTHGPVVRGATVEQIASIEESQMSATSIHAYLRASGAGSEHERVGPFLAAFTPGNDHPMRNYAIPDDDAEPSGDEVDAMVKVFERRGRRPRLEYAAEAAPLLEAILCARGFELERRLPVMTCRPARPRGALATPGDFVVALAETDRDHADAMVVADEAFGEPAAAPSAAAIAARRRMGAAGAAVVLARRRSDGEPAGSGLFQIPRAGVSEVAAVGTRVGFRNCGVASAVTARLLAAAAETGVELLWLTSEGPREERIYARAGFVSDGLEMVHISKPEHRRT